MLYNAAQDQRAYSHRLPRNSPVLKIGDWVEGAPGNMNSSTVRAALDSWINKRVTIPLFQEVTGNGANARYRICAFAQFVLINHDKTGVKGKFVRYVVRGEELSEQAPDFEARDVRIALEG